uniref:Toll-like receptor 2 n=1 Tax=Falco tinnunculus TaxID=100819 RepID=A0A8C4UID0_FALTI
MPAAVWCWALLVLAGVAAPRPCRIDAANRTGLCRGQDLALVPPGLPAALRHLDLSYNRLREVAAGAFAGLTQLRHLDLAYNNISRIAPDAFLSNLLLEHLRLFNNSLGSIPAPALRPLANLRWLDISNNPYRSAALDGAFGGLRALRELSLGGPLLQDISRGDFAVLKDTALRKFAIKSASGLRRYEAGAFSWLNTTELWCDVALDGSAAALPAMLRDLRGKPLDYLRFRNLFEFTYYTGDADPFAGLAELQITKLVFYRGKFSENLLRLALLNVQRSRICELALVAIDFARSPWQNGSSAGATAPRLNRLVLQDISNPDILRFDWTFTWLSGVAALSIINVNFNYVPCDVWGELRNVKTLDISGNRLRDSYIYNQLCHYQGVMPKLENFILASNQLLSLAVVATLTRTWPRLTRLDASHNSLGSLQETCQWSPTLRWLALHHNQVTVDTFRCLPTTLEYLDLSYSQLDRLDMDYFSQSPRLRELRLSGNKIKFIPSEWRCLRLEVLAIDGNSFGIINRGSFVNMPRLVSLAAGNNPYHCTCDLYLFLEETRRWGRPTLADWPHNWTCYHPEPLLDTAVATYTPRPLECNVPALVTVAVASTAVVVVVCAVLCWKLDAAALTLVGFARSFCSGWRTSCHPTGSVSTSGTSRRVAGSSRTSWRTSRGAPRSSSSSPVASSTASGATTSSTSPTSAPWGWAARTSSWWSWSPWRRGGCPDASPASARSWPPGPTWSGPASPSGDPSSGSSSAGSWAAPGGSSPLPVRRWPWGPPRSGGTGATCPADGFGVLLGVPTQG